MEIMEETQKTLTLTIANNLVFFLQQTLTDYSILMDADKKEMGKLDIYSSYFSLLHFGGIDMKNALRQAVREANSNWHRGNLQNRLTFSNCVGKYTCLVRYQCLKICLNYGVIFVTLKVDETLCRK